MTRNLHREDLSFEIYAGPGRERLGKKMGFESPHRDDPLHRPRRFQLAVTKQTKQPGAVHAKRLSVIIYNIIIERL
jgi:hypothetical protein